MTFVNAVKAITKDHDFDEFFKGLGGMNEFVEIKFPLAARMTILNKVLLIAAVQERQEFRFDGKIIYKVSKRKAQR